MLVSIVLSMQWCERRGRGVVGGCSVYSKVLDSRVHVTGRGFMIMTYKWKRYLDTESVCNTSLSCSSGGLVAILKITISKMVRVWLRV